MACNNKITKLSNRHEFNANKLKKNHMKKLEYFLYTTPLLQFDICLAFFYDWNICLNYYTLDVSFYADKTQKLFVWT